MPRRSLLDLTLAAPEPDRFIDDPYLCLSLSDLGSPLAEPLHALRGQSVLLLTQRQLPTVLALLALDGVAGRVYLCTPDLVLKLDTIIQDVPVDIILCDGTLETALSTLHCAGHPIRSFPSDMDRDVETEWVLFTSGTTGRPKAVAHTLSSLAGPLDDGVLMHQGTRWSTFYDVRRYGGLQIMLRALLGGGSLCLSDEQETASAFMERLDRRGVTHVSGTPSHWRRALMNVRPKSFRPRYVRLSGETADQLILDHLKRAFPTAGIAHAFASTEAGVGFDVRDGLAGFPAEFIPHPNGHNDIELRVIEGTLRIRSSRVASQYLGPDHLKLDADGFIDTGDLVEQQGARFYFKGRREGVINVGGQKVFPEEVEAVIAQHPDVSIARVWARKNPVTGAIVAADLLLRSSQTLDWNRLVADLATHCRQQLSAHKVPASWHRVDRIEMTPAGKLKRA